MLPRRLPLRTWGGGSLHWSVSEPPASGGAPPDWWTIEAQTVLGEWGISVIESGESYVILNNGPSSSAFPPIPAVEKLLQFHGDDAAVR